MSESDKTILVVWWLVVLWVILYAYQWDQGVQLNAPWKVLSQYEICKQWKPSNSHCTPYWNGQWWYKCYEWYADVWWRCEKTNKVDEVAKKQQNEADLARAVQQIQQARNNQIDFEPVRSQRVEFNPPSYDYDTPKVEPLKFDSNFPTKSAFADQQEKRKQECQKQEVEYYRELNAYELCDIRAEQELQSELIEYQNCQNRSDYFCPKPYKKSNCGYKPTKPFCF